MTAAMTLDEVDRAMERLGADCDRMAERLVGLDGHDGQRLLDSASLTGESQLRWTDAKATMARLWTAYEAYRSALAAARELRARRPRPSAEELARLTAVLRGEFVELPVDGGAMSLTASGSEWVSFAELTKRMNDDYGAVLSLVTAAVDGWAALAQRLDPLTERLASARSDAASLGLADDPELAAVDAELAALRSSDPLGWSGSGGSVGSGVGKIAGFVGPGSVDATSADSFGDHGGPEERLRAVGVRLDRAVERLARLRRVRDGYPELRVGLAARIEELGEALARAAELHETVRVKIVLTGAGPRDDGVADVDGLRGALDGLDGLRREQDWERLAERFAGVEALATGALAAARASAESLRQLLDRRSELRGRLDAYRAKAGRLGHGEDATLAALHRAAHELLWAAPCDLAAATRAVAGYQQAVLAATARRGEVPR